MQAMDRNMVGLRGVFALETMKTITVVSSGTRRTIPKTGTVFQVQGAGLVVADEMVGRLEDRIARGAKV